MTSTEMFICIKCKDTHRVWIDFSSRYIPCTKCPVPCSWCQGPNQSAYCKTAYCYCICHYKENNKVNTKGHEPDQTDAQLTPSGNPVGTIKLDKVKELEFNLAEANMTILDLKVRLILIENKLGLNQEPPLPEAYWKDGSQYVQWLFLVQTKEPIGKIELHGGMHWAKGKTKYMPFENKSDAMEWLAKDMNVKVTNAI